MAHVRADRKRKGFTMANITTARYDAAQAINARKKPGRELAAFTTYFLQRARRGEFDDLSDMSDGELALILEQASRADAGVWRESADDPAAAEEHAIIWGVYNRAKAIVDGRSRDRDRDRREQQQRQNAIFGLASAGNTLRKYLKADFSPALMCPPIEPPLTEEGARAIDTYMNLSMTADGSEFIVSLSREELDRINKALLSIEALIDSHALETALDDLRARRDHLVMKIEAEAITRDVAKAEIARRVHEVSEQERFKDELSETVRELQAQVAALESRNKDA